MYQLHALGWHSFQQLCLTVTREVLGQTVESFLDSNDAGMDGAFAGRWKPSEGQLESLSGRFVIQCKFTSKPGRPIRVSDLTSEQEKVKRLVDLGRCDTYMILTNYELTGGRVANLKNLFEAVGVKQVVILGSTWICSQIRDNKRLRMLMPRVYGLGDLSQILDERSYAQARAILDSLRDDLSKFVVSRSYLRAAEALNVHNFLLLVGAPAAGKSTIASLLAISAVDEHGASLVKPPNAEKLIDYWNPEEPSQFFWIDDAFGVTQYENSLVRTWNQLAPHFRTMLHRGAKIVVTSRDYIYAKARCDLKGGAFPLFKEAEVVVDVQDLSEMERQQILYNHLKGGKQSKEFLRRLRPYMMEIAAHPRFSPETARRLGDPLFIKDLRVEHIMNFVAEQRRFLVEVLQGLDRDSKAALAMIYMKNDRLESPIILQDSEEEALRRLGSNLGPCVDALKALNESLVQLVSEGDECFWRFKHPTIEDAYAEVLSGNPELLGVYLRGSTPEKLSRKITCGNAGIQNALVVPRGLFELVCERLEELSRKPGSNVRESQSWLFSFLALRCSKAFVALFLKRNPEILKVLASPGLLLSAVPEVELVVRLHDLELLPSDTREDFLRSVEEYTITGIDLYALIDPGIERVFGSSRFSDLVSRARIELVPRLGDVLSDWTFEWCRDWEPDGHLSPLLEAIDGMKALYSQDKEALRILDSVFQSADSWIIERLSEFRSVDRGSELRIGRSRVFVESSRSIFDDVHE